MRVWMPVRVVPAHGIGGGMEREAWNVAAGLVARGHEVRVVTTAHPSGRVEESVPPGVRTHHVPATTWRRYQRRWWAASYQLLQQEHRTVPYDVILSQSAGALGYMTRARDNLGIPSAVLLFGSARSELLTTARAARHPRGLYRLARLGWRLPRQLTAWRREAPAVEAWLAESEGVAAANERELRLPRGGIAVLPIGVDTDRFRPDPEARAALRARRGISPTAPLLVLATRLEREKGVGVALEAARAVLAHHPELHVLIAGTGHDERRLRRRAIELGLARTCTFLGLLDHDELPAVLAAGDLFVLPSLCEEARPVSAAEAGATGLPIVGSRADGIAAVVADGQTGLLVRRGDPGALTAAIVRLLGDDVTRQTMSHRARAQAVQHWSMAAMAGTVERVLVDVVAGRRADALPP